MFFKLTVIITKIFNNQQETNKLTANITITKKFQISITKLKLK